MSRPDKSPSRPRPAGLTAAVLSDGWRAAGVTKGMALMVHSSLSSLGYVQGGARTVAESLRTAVGTTGTVVVPAFTRQVADPDPMCVGIPDAAVRARRAAVPTFHRCLTSSMGAIPEAVRTMTGSARSKHPQASVAAIGAHASFIVGQQSLGFALGAASPWGRLHEMGGHILLIGVGHNRNTFLHHAESLTPHPRLKVRRLPYELDGERVWIETLDVGNDNDTYFPVIGREFEEQAGIREVRVGEGRCRLIPVRPFVSFAVRRLTELLAAPAAVG
jgi:aminoglycoside 3-N-acetyltransferase